MSRGRRGRRGRRGFRGVVAAIDETASALPSAFERAVAELAEQVNADPRGPLLPTLSEPRPPSPPRLHNPLMRPVARVWQGLQAPPDGTEPSLAQRLRAGQRTVQVATGRRNGRSYRRRQLRESLDGVLAIFDPLRGGDRRRPWVVIDVPPGHHTHHRDQPLADRDVQDWTVLIRATGWPRTDQP